MLEGSRKRSGGPTQESCLSIFGLKQKSCVVFLFCPFASIVPAQKLGEAPQRGGSSIHASIVQWQNAVLIRQRPMVRFHLLALRYLCYNNSNHILILGEENFFNHIDQKLLPNKS